MIRQPKRGQVVQLWYRTSLRPVARWHGWTGTVEVLPRGPGPRNVGVRVGWELVIVPRGHLRRPPASLPAPSATRYDHLSPRKDRCHRERLEVRAIRDVPEHPGWRDADLWELDLLKGVRLELEESGCTTVGTLSDRIEREGCPPTDVEAVLRPLDDWKTVLERNARMAKAKPKRIVKPKPAEARP